MAGIGKPGPASKPVEQHLREGTYRHYRHKHLLGDLSDGVLDYPKKPPGKIVATAASQSRWCRSVADERAVRNGCRFNERLAEHAAEFFPKLLRHSKGEWAGQPFELLPWQRDELIYPLFGWVKPDGRRRFERCYIEVPKKNGKSTLASGVGLYMLMADGEGGAEVYSTAADRDQASIVHGEAMNMVRASDHLTECVKINLANRNIAYPFTQSIYRSLSSKAGGKEGLNAHCTIIDELHVWRGRDFWDTLRYAYRARRQPLQFVITTAGTDMQSVCWGQHERALGVLSGDVKDDGFFGLIYAADRDDDWLDEAVWRKANPSFGATIQPDRFRQDALEAKASPSNEAVFKRYSLNIWGTASTPWLSGDRWAECGADYTEDDLAGEPCFAGLDLSKTSDMSSLVLVFPRDDGTYRMLAYFWLPEDTIKSERDVLDYPQWVADGWLTAIPGPVIENEWIEKKIVEAAEQFDLRQLVYDPMYAADLCERLERDHGIEPVKFPQTIVHFADPTAEFERLVTSGKLQHNCNPVLSWQAGHVQVKIDVNNNKRPVKPPSEDQRKIDGIVAAIMGLSRATAEEVGSVYDSPDHELVVL